MINDELCHMPIGDIMIQYSEKNINDYEPVSIGKHGIRLRSEVFGRQLNMDNKKNKVIYKDTLTIGMGSKTVDYSVLHQDNYYSVSPDYKTFNISCKIDTYYWDMYFKVLADKLFYLYAKENTRNGRRIDINSLLKHKVTIATNNSWVGYYLSQIDNLIDTANVKNNVLKDTHKEMINNLNTLDEEKIFIKFSELFMSLDGLKNVTKESFNTENTTSKYISFKNIHNQSFALEDLANVDIENNSKQNMVKYNDLLITMSSENMNEIGTTTINKLNCSNIYLNSFSKILRNQSIYDSDYLNYLLKTKESRKLIITEGQGITRINLSVNRLLNLKFNIYSDINVQKRASIILSQMDKLIEIEEKKLEQLEKMKKYHLQQFFN